MRMVVPYGMVSVLTKQDYFKYMESGFYAETIGMSS